jgi:hypothetical protein
MKTTPLVSVILALLATAAAALADAGPKKLLQLGDVSLTSPATGQVLLFDSGRWRNKTPAQARDYLEIDNDDDVTFGSLEITSAGVIQNESGVLGIVGYSGLRLAAEIGGIAIEGGVTMTGTFEFPGIGTLENNGGALRIIGGGGLQLATESGAITIGGLTVTGSTGTLTIPNGVTLTGPAASGTAATLAGTETLSNKRATARVATVASSAMPSYNTDSSDIVSIASLSVAITSMTSGATGTPANGDLLSFRIRDNGTARAITWGEDFAAGPVALPTTTTTSKTLRTTFEYDSALSRWVCVATGSDL